MTKPIHPAAKLSARYSEEWTDEEKWALRDMVGYMSRAEIGKVLGRTPLAVQGQCNRMGLRLIRDDLGHRRFYEAPIVEGRSRAEENDSRFVRALAAAISRGDHLSGAGA